MVDSAKAADWHLYIVRTNNGELYTGITTDVERRFAEHCAGGARSARYLRGREPLTLVFNQKIGDRSAASKAEWAVKQLARQDKEAIISGRLSLDRLLST